MPKILSIILFLVSIIYLPFPISLFSLIIFLYLNKYLNKYIVIFGYILLFIFQIYSTRIQSNLEFSGYQNFLHQQNLDSYPPSLFRIGNIVENKIESPLFYRFRQNIFNCFDFVNYFKNYFITILFIPFIFGLIKLIKSSNKTFLNLLIISIVLLAFIGTDGKYGPLLLLPFIVNIISFYSCET